MPRTRSHSVPTKGPPPPPTPPPSPVGPTGPSMLESLKHGMGVGAGLELSRQLIQGISSSSAPVSPTSSNSCDMLYENMIACIDREDLCDIHIECYRKCMSQQ
jgi:hypothetical protein